MYEDIHPLEETLYAYLDGELEQEDKASLETHLEGCPDCAQRLEEMRSLFTTLEGLEDLALERDLSNGVLAKIHSISEPPAIRLVFALQALMAMFLLAFAWPLLGRSLSLEPITSLGLRLEATILETSGEWLAFWHTYPDGLRSALGQAISNLTDLMTNILSYSTSIGIAWERFVKGTNDLHISPLELTVLLSVATALWLIGNKVLLGASRSENHLI